MLHTSPFFRINEWFSRKRAEKSKKKPCYVFGLIEPHLHAKFRKKGAVFEICRYARTDVRTDARTHGAYLIDPFGLQPGTKNINFAFFNIGGLFDLSK
jgi:hypothetical protein